MIIWIGIDVTEIVVTYLIRMSYKLFDKEAVTAGQGGPEGAFARIAFSA